jgi:AcrR family transcriptional regulator
MEAVAGSAGTADGGGQAATRTAVDPWAYLTPESSRRLLVTALEAFADQGYHATTTRDIATRAGMSPAALDVHFPSKGALLAQISRVGHQASLELVRAALARGEDPVARLRAVVGDFAAWHAEHHRVARVVHYELAALPEEDRSATIEVRRQIEDLVAEEIRAGVASGTMRVADPRQVARAMLSMAVDVARWYHPGRRETPASIGALYADLATRMVGVGE